MARTRVGVLGSGNVGRTLARGFAQEGFDVRIGSRTPERDDLSAWAKGEGGGVVPGSFGEAAAHGEILVLATLGSAAIEAVDLAGPARFAGKLVIDTTNPLDFTHGMPPGLFVGTTDSLGERLQHHLPDARVVKCFNTVPHALMVHPQLPGPPPTMLVCGNDSKAKARTEKILRQFGWGGAIDVGGIESARWLEALVPLWVRVGAAIGTHLQIFQVVKAPAGPQGSARGRSVKGG